MTYQLSGLAENEFKNGLDGKHFKSMSGDLIYQEFQPPADPNTVMEQKSVHSYDVLSRSYTYRDAQFSLNRITSGEALKYVALGRAIVQDQDCHSRRRILRCRRGRRCPFDTSIARSLALLPVSLPHLLPSAEQAPDRGREAR